ncbi:Protein of unknown function [Flexibacter flexilis DSM 6793]|uniref:Inner membrane protein YgaP-like transmembrane domain-containing protein n=1 Tax=Flexibacter flexilis DSM 6793 TaxID=927664 RepID=A0A1I1N2G0_9BACT|nr:DUF2892 domain-containing protein [Flexibacter flexilis]SFC89033.1 Protein of unknown function [Flexibacter flexilis DSM 6793]
MKANMGLVDRGIRIAVALVIATLSFTHVIEGTLEIILLVFGFVFVLTSLVSFCPLYTIFGINTCKVKK